MPSRKHRASVEQQNRDPATGRWLPGKKKTGSVKKPSAVKKARASPSPTSSNEAIQMWKAEAEDEMRYMSFWDLQKEVGALLQNIKEIEEKLAMEKGKKKVTADSQQKKIVSLKDELLMEKSRKEAFQEAVVDVSKTACPRFWARFQKLKALKGKKPVHQREKAQKAIIIDSDTDSGEDLSD